MRLTQIEKLFYIWFLNKASEFEDGETGLSKCCEIVCEQLNLSFEIVEWVCEVYTTESALEAGIPLSVIQGETKLSDHFSKDYIRFKRGIK